MTARYGAGDSSAVLYSFIYYFHPHNPSLLIMSNTISVYIENVKRHIEVSGGDNLLDVLAKVAGEIAFEPVCAMVNNKIESLKYPLYAPKTVRFLSAATAPGNRTYIRSLCMMLYHAVNALLPGSRLRIEHSLSGGYFCRVDKPDGTPLNVDELHRLEDHMRSLVARDLPFRRAERRTEEVIALFKSQGLDDKVQLLTTLHELYTVYYTLDGLSDSYYGPLVPSTGLLTTFSLVSWENGVLLLGPDRADTGRVCAIHPQPKMYQAFSDYVSFNNVLGISTVGELNRSIEQGESRSIVNVSEALHNNRIAAIAEEITRRFRAGGAKVVMIAGPSSSGKTTFTKRLGIQLMTNKLKPKMISLDDYFVDRAHTPRDADGEYDYESLYALDLETFNRHINALIRGEEVELPYYNFSTGEREYRGNRMQRSPENILLIEGIHGLNPELTSQVPEEMKYRVYVSALTTISIDDHNWVPTTDNRLLRRIIRDAKYRGVTPVETIRRWPSVRRGEERWIFPYQENAGVMFNSALLFELGVMKDRADSLLRQVPHDEVEYAEAQRLRTFLGYFHSIPETYIPSTSLLREFLGGSSFKY